MLGISKTSGQHSFSKFTKLIYFWGNKRKENQVKIFLTKALANYGP